ncbi:pentatricopeptide repeat-containing protein At1g73400, mitochondrial-like [Telopea speciosissima]|uniref:pentatricopeptide repeat-containing protein At1g73400, mitochondrial-like n=1 Tax=Telopea speciosissima TaxID=54955 RepID=UPI001CC73A10|nr:pentatricopeptide repeat-containing protein At1g73400, mitochondrial-like [Telopea speciosissima]
MPMSPFLIVPVVQKPLRANLHIWSSWICCYTSVRNLTALVSPHRLIQAPNFGVLPCTSSHLLTFTYRFFSSYGCVYLPSLQYYQSSAFPAIGALSHSSLLGPPLSFPSCSSRRNLGLLGSLCVLTPLTVFRVFSCSFCSEVLSVDRRIGGCRTNVQDESIAIDSDILYKTIIENSSVERSMEKALDQAGIKLRTELVDEVLRRLHFEEKIAFRFFMWAGHQEGYSHQPQTYNEMFDILSSTKYKVKQFRIVCDMLDYMKRKDRNSVPIEVLLTILRNYTEKHLTHLQKFTKKKRIRVKTQPETNAFNLLLDALCKCSLVEEAEAMFMKIKNKVSPDANTYNILFFGWCRVRNPTRGMRVLEEMIDLGLTPDNFTYTTAIDTFCKAGMVSEAAALFDFMRTKGSTMSSPTAKTYTIMIVALAQSDRIGECFKLLADMRDSGCLPDVSTYKELIEGMCSVGKIEETYRVLEEMGKKGYPPDIVTYNCFLKVLCDLRKADEALILYGRMIEVGCVPSVHTFNMLITMFFEISDSDGAFETWHEMDKRGCLRNTDTYCVMIEGLFGCAKREDACFLLEEVVNKGMKLPYQKFDSFLKQLSLIGDLQAIHRLSEHMRRFYNTAMARRFALSQKRKSMALRRK